MVAFRTPTFQTLVGGATPISSTEAYKGTVNSRVALHNDAFLSSSSDVGTFSNTTKEYPYLEIQSKYKIDCPLSISGNCKALEGK